MKKSMVPLNILIVDDEIIVRETLTAMLKHLGHTTDSAPDGLAGKETIETNIYDAAFVDIRMPGMDGISLLKWAKESGASLQIIIMTGHGEEESREESLRNGAFAFLSKPFKLDEIMRLLIQLKDLRGIQKANHI